MLYLKATSTGTSPSSLETVITSLCIKSSSPSKYFTKSESPPEKWNVISSSSVFSLLKIIVRFLFKYANSFNLTLTVSSSNPICLNISESGLKVIIVPLLSVFPIFSTSVVGIPLEYSCL